MTGTRRLGASRLLAAGLLVAAPLGLQAHHSVTLYDTERLTTITGTVSQVYWEIRTFTIT